MRPGVLFADRFEIQRRAGAGGMGEVFLARDRHAGTPVAVKVLRGRDPHLIERFDREAALLASLDHPGIVRHVAHGVASSGEPFLAMEWLEGETLSERLSREGLTFAESVRLGKLIAGALAAMHRRGVVHRDLKPGNLFLEGGRVEGLRVLDLGIARQERAEQLTMTGAALGTPGYMAPEQARGERDVDARADVFSLGCVLFKCLTGQMPFPGDDVLPVLLKIVLEDAPSARSLHPDVPEALDALLSRMLAKAPGERPSSAAEVLEALEALEASGALEPGGASGARRVAPAASQVALTSAERKVLTLLLVGAETGPPDRDDDAEATLLSSQIEARERDLLASATSFGGEAERLADGTWVVTIGDGRDALDQAVRAARSALALRGLLPDAPMVVVSGRGVASARLPLGEALERGAAMLRDEAAAGAGGGPRAVRLDEASAGLLALRFDVGGDERGLHLRGERDADEAARTLLGKQTSFVGRERELAELEHLFDEVVSEPVSRAALVTAPAGVGKSRLRFELVRKLQAAHDLEVWCGRGDPMGPGSPFGLVAALVRQASGIRDGEPLAVRQRKLRARLARHVPAKDLPRVTEFLGELVSAPFPDEESVQLRAARQDPVLMGDQMRRALEDFLAAECGAGPVLVVLEDLQWGDLPSLRFFDAALRNLPERPLLILALGRPEVHDLFPRLWEAHGVHALRLGELSRRGGERLVREILGAAFPDERVAEILDKAGGNAFFLEELIRAAAERREGDLPGSVLAMVEARLDALEPEARRLLRAGSVFGQVFWRGGVLSLLGGDERTLTVEPWLVELTRREIVVRRGESKFPGDAEHAFRHGLLREAAYATLTEADRRLGHRLAGAWLERAGSADPAVLAEHFERGGEPALAVGWYAKAAEQSLEGNDFEAALALARRAVGSGAAGSALASLGLLQAEAHRFRGENAEAAARAEAALTSCSAGESVWFTAMGELATARAKRGEREPLAEVGRRLLEVAPLSPPSAPRAIATARAAIFLLHAGERDLAFELLADLGGIAPALGDEPVASARIHQARADAALLAGDPETFLTENLRAALRLEQAGDVRTSCNVRVNVGYAHMEFGDYGAAERVLRAALGDAIRMGLSHVACAARHNLGLALARLGALDEARAVEGEAIAGFAAQGSRRLEGASRVYQALILELAGELEEAEAEALRAASVLESVPPSRAHALAALAAVRLRRGDAPGARIASDEGMALLGALGAIESGEPLLRLVHAEALRAAGEDGRGAIREARAALLARAERIGDPDLREGFLARVPEHARTLELAYACLGAEPSAPGVTR